MLSRRDLLSQLAVAAVPWVAAPQTHRKVPEQIRSFCIDFNWLHQEEAGKPVIFAPPGHWADASPEEHVRWYHELGANTIQTFVVSCNGYAWYKGGFVPPQPGLKHDFLREVADLGHKKGMLVLGYFCVGANTKWGRDRPGLSYGTPTAPHIPLTDPYLDYLSRSMEDAIRNTEIDGYMVDWLWSPGDKLQAGGWIDSERALYTQLTGEAFPKSGAPGAAELLAYRRRAVERCWSRIKEVRDRARRDCILWLTVSNLADPVISASPVLRECDWVLNEAPSPELYDSGRKMVGPQTRLIQNLVGWVNHDAKGYLSAARNLKIDLYGFAEPRASSLPLPIADYLARPIDSFQEKTRMGVNDRNIAALARFYRGLPLDAVIPRGGAGR